MKKLTINQKSNRSGFTLVELVIVIAIVIILSVISVPIYRGYVDKAKYSEGYALGATIITAQKAYYSEYGNFLRNDLVTVFSSFHPDLGVDARGNKYFTSFRIVVNASHDPRTYFSAIIEKPLELRNNNINGLAVYYHILSGGVIKENV